jgi:hypothetical protein
MRLPPGSPLVPAHLGGLAAAPICAFVPVVLIATIMGMVMPGVPLADELVVPDDFLTIQAAVDFAASGDNILVRPGAYRENILIVGKSLRIESAAGPDVTVIDGRSPTRPDTLSVITVIGAEEFVCRGFTIRNSLGGIDFAQQSGADSGGGLALLAVNGELSNCIITQNFCQGNGGGIHLVVSGMLVQDCVISGNQCGGNGGGIDIFACSPTIARCVIENNHAGPDGLGGGIYVFLGASPVNDCKVAGNRAAAGGGIGLRNSSATILHTVIIDNATTMGLAPAGGGLLSFGGGPRIESCTVVRNESAGVSGLWFFDEVNAVVARSIVAFNIGEGAMTCSGGLSVECCDIFGNNGSNDICGSDLGGNFALDPILCVDNSIAASSPCAAGNSPAGCELVGALDVGCTEAVIPVTWGQVKHFYGAVAR